MSSCAITHFQDCPPNEKSSSCHFCPSLNSSSIHEEKPAGTALLSKHPQYLELFQAKASPVWSSWEPNGEVKTGILLSLRWSKSQMRFSWDMSFPQNLWSSLSNLDVLDSSLKLQEWLTDEETLSFSLKPKTSWIPPHPLPIHPARAMASDYCQRSTDAVKGRKFWCEIKLLMCY